MMRQHRSRSVAPLVFAALLALVAGACVGNGSTLATHTPHPPQIGRAHV
mgnify:CR=1 FL=1